MFKRAFSSCRLRAGIVACAALGAVAVATAAAADPLQVARMAGAAACVALTFDDGPDATLTPKLLSVLEQKNVNVTFFVIGSRAASWPDPVARAAADGDEIGNHTWDHPPLPSLADAAALKELTRTDDEIQKITGQVPTVTRAPYGSMSPRIADLSPRTYVAWSIDTLDWKYPNVARITAAAVNKAVNGSIILMHDIHPKTVQAVPGIIDGLRARGFQLVTVSELLGGTCGGTAFGYGVQVPGDSPLDPFGVAAFQGQQVDGAKAAVPAGTVVKTAQAAGATAGAKPAPLFPAVPTATPAPSTHKPAKVP